MNKLELYNLNGFLSKVSDEMGNAGCNDHELPNTAENRQMVRNMWKHVTSGEDLEQTLEHFENVYEAVDLFGIPHRTKIIVQDWMLFAYLRHRMNETLKNHLV